MSWRVLVWVCLRKGDGWEDALDATEESGDEASWRAHMSEQ